MRRRWGRLIDCHRRWDGAVSQESSPDTLHPAALENVEVTVFRLAPDVARQALAAPLTYP